MSLEHIQPGSSPYDSPIHREGMGEKSMLEKKKASLHARLREVAKYLRTIAGAGAVKDHALTLVRKRLTKDQAIQYYQGMEELFTVLVGEGEERKKHLTYLNGAKRKNERVYNELKRTVNAEERDYKNYIQDSLTQCERIMYLKALYATFAREDMECTFEEFLEKNAKNISAYVANNSTHTIGNYVIQEGEKIKEKGDIWQLLSRNIEKSKSLEQLLTTIQSTGGDKTIIDSGLYYLFTKTYNMELLRAQSGILLDNSSPATTEEDEERYKKKHLYELGRPKATVEEVEQLFTLLQKKKPVMERMYKNRAFLDEQLEKQKEEGGIVTYTLQEQQNGEGLDVLVLWDKRTSYEYTSLFSKERGSVQVIIDVYKKVFGVEERNFPQGFCPLTILHLADEQPDFTHTAFPGGSMRGILHATGSHQLFLQVLKEVYEQLIADCTAFEAYEEQGEEAMTKGKNEIKEKIEAVRVARWEVTEVVQGVMNKYKGGIPADYSGKNVQEALKALATGVDMAKGDHRKGKNGGLRKQQRSITIDYGRDYYDEYILKNLCREQGIPFAYLLVALDKKEMKGKVQEMICEDLLLRMRGEPPILVILE